MVGDDRDNHRSEDIRKRSARWIAVRRIAFAVGPVSETWKLIPIVSATKASSR